MIDTTNSGRTFSTTVQIAAPCERVWQVMIDVEHWAEWTPSVTSVKRLDAGPLAIGSRARILQPSLRPAVWRVTDIQVGRMFTWVSGGSLLRVTGRHIVESVERGSRVTLSVQFEGFFGWLAARVFRKLNERYLDMEATGLKRRCEAGNA
jgi:uncharacterized membrane protein